MTAEQHELERHNRVPRGFLVLFFALIAWGIYYIAAYTPRFSGWSQYRIYEAERRAELARSAQTPAGHENPYEQDPKAVVEGQVIFRENCAGCHGATLRGGVGPDLTGHLKYGETDGRMFESVRDGRAGGMPAFGAQLGRERIWKVIAYVDSVREGGAKP